MAIGMTIQMTAETRAARAMEFDDVETRTTEATTEVIFRKRLGWTRDRDNWLPPRRSTK
ncbi:MAG: hypothetical protein WB622_06020 [Acidobacteriaceae bacterium]